VKIALSLRPELKISTPSYITFHNERYAMTETIQRIVLASRPVGEPTLDNFRSEKLPIPHLGSDEMLLRTLWLSLDPYMRGRMSDAPSYAKPVGIGALWGFHARCLGLGVRGTNQISRRRG
jgi:NADPH-dependent curcumin reductase CurA